MNDTVWGLRWPGVALNSAYVLPCPQGAIGNVSGELKCLLHLTYIRFISYDTGMAYKFCSSTGDWGPTNVTQCESYTIRHLTQQVRTRKCTMALSGNVLLNVWRYNMGCSS